MVNKIFSYVSKLGTKKYVFIFVLLAQKLFVTEIIVNNFLMVLLGINVETSLSS